MISTILFDFDGTLADTELIVLNAVNKYADQFGYKKVEDHNRFREMESLDVLKNELEIPIWKIPYIAWKAKIMAKTELKYAKLFPKIKEVIEKLQESYKVIIVTSNNKELVENIFKKDKLKIDAISSSSFFIKDYQLMWVLRKFKLNKEECVYVGDEIRDVKACNKVGIQIIGVSWGYNSAEALKKEGAEFIAKTPEDIIEIIKKKC
ncbi:MAG: HAD-IA family hydrolase [Candidatus Woesearchaeota archaeon]